MRPLFAQLIDVLIGLTSDWDLFRVDLTRKQVGIGIA